MLNNYGPLSVQELKKAETPLFKCAPWDVYKDKFFKLTLEQNTHVESAGSLYSYSP